MYKTGSFTFYKGSDYRATARAIDEKLAEASKEHDQLIDADSIVAIEYAHNLAYYKYKDE